MPLSRINRIRSAALIRKLLKKCGAYSRAALIEGFAAVMKKDLITTI